MATTQKLVLGTWKIVYSFHSIAVLLLIAFVIVVVYLKGDSEGFLEQQKTPDDSIPHCNLFSGKWVYDNISYPLYKENQCSFMELDFACEKFGRKDLNYQKWRWQPHDCDLPRNQWTSMLCLIESSIPSSSSSSSKSLIWKGNSIIFKATDYNATIQFYWQWTDADILVFDSFVWWEEPKITLLWGSFESSDAIYKEVGRSYRHYEMALNTWSDWLEININRSRTKLFFMSLSPHHRVGEDWGRDKGRNCYSETEPVLKEGYRGSTTDGRMMQIEESAIHELETRGLKLEFLNITQLADYRKDAHPSVYKKFWMNLTEEQLARPESYSDCVHWCLPGVPDVWNVILFSYIMHS
ncbi:unnamed protein product [Fraxinus pennsylvanica]|uniref:Trichome birefringence-like N-terminal domain-containing protein n=1 Tax=Fraxinus pennsylvanica TaxID=56036 RepID=A0AAD1ZSA2_9LAMI|nr:unnamed protein product [Fraxinus pennsylvanica]